MSVIEHSETLPGSAEALFDLTQDYSVRLRWDPFPQSYRFLAPATGPEVGAVVIVRARNGRAMTVRYVSYNRPRAAAIDMVDGPWFISAFAGAWSFKRVSERETRVSFKYRVVARPPACAGLADPAAAEPVVPQACAQALGRTACVCRGRRPERAVLAAPQGAAAISGRD